jgi:HAD superfamily hydrolase (TIGR01509 family)
VVVAERSKGLEGRRRRPAAGREIGAERVRPAGAAADVRAPTRPVDLEALCARWRVALDAEAAAYSAARGTLPPAELAAGRSRLDEERRQTLALLRAVARDHRGSGRFLHLTPRGSARRLLGLPTHIAACVFNLDGVLVGSATLHAAAWMQTFDEFIWARTERTGGRFAPFDPRTDYPRHMHGRPRLEGVREFLASRGISLPEGSPTDPAGAETVHGLARRKNEVLRRRIDEEGVTAYDGSLAYLQLAGEAGIHRAVVSASANTQTILDRTGLAPLVDACVDGNTMVEGHLRAKPAPDAVLAACRLLAVEPNNVAAFETTEAGVAAATAAGCAVIVGIDPFGRSAALRASGAAPVIPSLAELLEQRLAA